MLFLIITGHCPAEKTPVASVGKNKTLFVCSSCTPLHVLPKADKNRLRSFSEVAFGSP